MCEKKRPENSLSFISLFYFIRFEITLESGHKSKTKGKNEQTYALFRADTIPGNTTTTPQDRLSPYSTLRRTV